MKVSNFIEIATGELTGPEWDRLFKQLRYADAEGNVYEPWRFLVRKNAVRLPRGAWNLLPEHVEYVDNRVCPEFPLLDYTLKLDDEILMEDGKIKKFSGQKEAVEKMLLNEQGLVVRPPGTGKSQIILAFAAICGTNVLILVHTEDILNQWVKYAHRALPKASIGIIRAEEETIGQITIATVQTFHRRLHKEPKKWQSMFGAVILDEAHHASAKTFEQVLNMMKAKYRFGVTATKRRADKRDPYMKLVIGPIIYEMKFSSPIPVEVIPVKTGMRFRYRGPYDWGRLLRALISDEKRNTEIARIADEEVEKGQSVLILSRRIEHLQEIAGMMESFPKQGALLVGAWVDEDGNKHKLSRETRASIVQKLREGEIRVVLATQLADEALDVPILSRIILTHPGKHDGRIIQQVGRALREFPGKDDAKVYDVVDDKIGVLRRQWMERKRTYGKLGIPIRKTRKGGNHG